MVPCHFNRFWQRAGIDCSTLSAFLKCFTANTLNLCSFSNIIFPAHLAFVRTISLHWLIFLWEHETWVLGISHNACRWLLSSCDEASTSRTRWHTTTILGTSEIPSCGLHHKILHEILSYLLVKISLADWGLISHYCRSWKGFRSKENIHIRLLHLILTHHESNEGSYRPGLKCTQRPQG